MEIKVLDLSKKYGEDLALDELSLTLTGNKIIGLLGKNGAGKTTFMRMLAGHFRPSSGELQINQQTPFNNYSLMKHVCLIMESNNFYEKFRVRDILEISAKFYPHWDALYAEELRKTFRLKEKQKVKTLSKGMYSALGIIVGLASNAPVTIFDEPYIGLDASFRSIFYDLLLESYENNPRLIILSTHLIDEVSKLFEEVVIIQEGKLLLHESVDELAGKHILLSGKRELVEQVTANRNVIHETSMMGHKTAVLFDESIGDTKGLEVSQASLQELFVYLTKEEVKRHARAN